MKMDLEGKKAFRRAAWAAGLGLLLLCGGARAAVSPQETGQAASVPEEVNYHGRLTQNGLAVSGNRSAVFRLYDALTGGNLLWQQSATLVADGGLFNVSLALSTSALSGGGARYLEIEVETSVLSPGEFLGAHPTPWWPRRWRGAWKFPEGGSSFPRPRLRKPF